MRVLGLSVGGEALDRRGGEARGGGLLPHVLGGVGEAGRAVHAMEARELAHGLEGRHAVDLGVDRGGDGVGPEGNRPLLGRAADRADEPGKRRGGPGALPSRANIRAYCATVNGTSATVLSQAIASLPPASDMSTKPIVN